MPSPNPRALAPLKDAGYELIPLRGREKAPRDPRWTTHPYKNEDQVAHMEAGNNVGVRLRATDLVVDVDPRNFEDAWDGVDPFSELVLRLGLDPTEWPRVETGGGGAHYYMTKPGDVPVRDSLPDFPGVEFKTLGRQVVAPGSVHPETERTYTWAANAEDLWCAPACPEALLEAIRRQSARASGAEAGVHTAEELAAMLEALDPEDFREHDDWLTLMQACHHATSGAGREEFIGWSTGDPEYADHAGIIGRRWDSLRAETDGPAVTHRTLHKLLMDAGAEDAIPRAPAEEDFEIVLAEDLPAGTVMDVPSVLSRGLKVGRNSVAPDTIANAIIAVVRSPLMPAYDELKQQVVFKAGQLPWDEEYGRTLDDNTVRLVRHYLIAKHQGNDYQPSKENVWEAVTTLAYEHKFNPVLRYLDGLEWDGVPRVERLFPGYFGVADSDFARAVSRCFMVAAVRRQRRPGCKFDTMPVLRGPQGGGKSTGVRHLFGDDWFSDAETGDLKGKDAALTLQGVWAQEFAELDGMRRTDVDTLKAFCSRAVDRVRPPYGRSVLELPRRCVFVGTANEGGYLKDGTGNRRFWPLEVPGRVDLAAILRDRDQLWAEADRLERDGAGTVLDEALWGDAAERQASETSDDPWADVLLRYIHRRKSTFECAALGDLEDEDGLPIEAGSVRPPNKAHTWELLGQALGIAADRQNRAHAQRLRTVMEQSVGWRYKRSLRIGGDVAAGYEAPSGWRPTAQPQT